ncbi:MAG: GxxExxY protein [Bacteroidia bacterium]|nr:GxxExxY protein [Bacteroidia bacterium]
MIADNFKHSEITGKILKAFFNVYNTIGYGFYEKVYENALSIELKKLNLKCENQRPVTVYYEGNIVGSYFADIIVEDKVIVELKAVDLIIEEHEIQLVNYLRATEMEVGLLLNFGTDPQYKRKVLSNEFKKHFRS